MQARSIHAAAARVLVVLATLVLASGARAQAVPPAGSTDATEAVPPPPAPGPDSAVAMAAPVVAPEVVVVPPPPATPRQVVVVDAITYGIAPIVGRVTSDQLRRTAADMGYTILPQNEGVRTFQALRMHYPPAPADLWRLGWATRSHRAIFARVWANEGRYVIEVIVASIDGAPNNHRFW